MAQVSTASPCPRCSARRSGPASGWGGAARTSPSPCGGSCWAPAPGYRGTQCLFYLYMRSLLDIFTTKFLDSTPVLGGGQDFKVVKHKVGRNRLSYLRKGWVRLYVTYNTFQQFRINSKVTTRAILSASCITALAVQFCAMQCVRC